MTDTSSPTPHDGLQTSRDTWPAPNPGALWVPGAAPRPPAAAVGDRHLHAGHGHTDFANSGYGSPGAVMSDPQLPGAEFPRPGYPMRGYPPAAGAPAGPPVQAAATGGGKGWIVGVVLGLVTLLVVGGVVLGLTSRNHTKATAPAHTVSLPAAVAGYYRLQTPGAQTIANSMSTQMTNLGQQWKAGQVGVYSPTGAARPALIMYAISAADSPELAAQLPTAAPGDLASEAFSGSGVTGEKDYPAGAFGGVLRCGSAHSSGVGVGLCIWVDSSTMGMVVMPGTAPQATAVAAQSMRAVTER